MKTIALIGAGARGRYAYGNYVLENQEKVKYVAVVEIDEAKRNEIQKEHKIAKSLCFANEEDFFALGKIADGVIIATQDKQHFKTTLKALEIGYDVLVEKPMSPNSSECIEMAEVAQKNQRVLMVCHVLRYTKFYEKVKELLEKNTIGELMGVDHTENIGNYHMAHSFVRGNWRNSEQSSPIILAKTCHDTDLLNWLISKKCESVYSKGSLKFFKKENAPKESTKKCMDCPLQDQCQYSAKTIYLEKTRNMWPATTLAATQDIKTLKNVLETTSYGTCVWKIDDNNVCDHQVSLLSYPNVDVTFTLTAFTNNQYRETRLFGTKGYIVANTLKNEIKITYHGLSEESEAKTESIYPEILPGAHSGGDMGLMEDFCNVLEKNTKNIRTSAAQSLESHLMCNALEKSRIENKIVNMDDYENTLKIDFLRK